MVDRPRRKRCRRMEQRIGETVARSLRSVRALHVRDETVQSLLEAAPGVWRESNVDERRGVVLAAPGDDLVGSLSQHRRREHATFELVRHRRRHPS